MFYKKNCKKKQLCIVLLVFFAFVGLANPFQQAPGAMTIATAISYLSKNPISKA